MKKFKEWLKLREVSTSTASIAAYARPLLSEPLRTRKKIPFIDKKLLNWRGKTV